MKKLCRKIISIFPKGIQNLYYKYEEILMYLIFGVLTTVVSFITAGIAKWGLESAYSADAQETVSPKPQEDYYVGGASIGGVKKGTTIATGDTIEKDNEDDEKNKK